MRNNDLSSFAYLILIKCVGVFCVRLVRALVAVAMIFYFLFFALKLVIV